MLSNKLIIVQMFPWFISQRREKTANQYADPNWMQSRTSENLAITFELLNLVRMFHQYNSVTCSVNASDDEIHAQVCIGRN